MLQCVAACYSVDILIAPGISYRGRVAVRCSALQCVAVCCSVLQCVAACYSVDILIAPRGISYRGLY